MPMTEEERRRCCLLGGCGCPPYGAEQRAAMRQWLVEKVTEDLKKAYLPSVGPEHPGYENGMAGLHIMAEVQVDRWIDELFAGAESA